jgi:hypothetical protein
VLILPLFCCWRISLGIFLIYFFIIFLRSCQISEKTTCWHQVIAFMVLHFSYAFGEMAGLFEMAKMFIKGKRK